MSKFISNQFFLINFFLIIIYFFINSKLGHFFDGIPFNSKAETITLLCVIPFLLIFNYQFIISKIITYLFVILILIKALGLIFLPQQGLFFDAYSKLEKDYIIKKIEQIDPEEKNKYARKYLKKLNTHKSIDFDEINLYKTFNSIWNPNNTALITRNIISKHEFPLDWARGLNLLDWRELTVDFYISGKIFLKKNEFLIVELNETKNIEDLNKLNERIIFYNNINEFNKNYIIEKDFKKEVQFSFNKTKISYDKYDWKFKAFIYDIKKDKYLNPFNNKRFLIDTDYNQNITHKIITFFLLISELIVIVFLFCWFLISSYNLINKNKDRIKITNFISISILSFIMPIFLYYIFYISQFKDKLQSIDATYISPLGFSIILIFSLTLFFNIDKNNNKFTINDNILISNKLCSILFVLPILGFFSIAHSNTIVEIINYPLEGADDWATIFNLSKIISVYNDFLPARYCLHNIHNTLQIEYIDFIKIDEIRNIFCKGHSGSVYHHNPLYRYVLSFLSSFFGHGSFVVRILDIWCIIIVIYFGIYFLIHSKINIKYLYLFIFIYLFINFVGPSRYLIGRGKEEFLSMAFIVLATMLFYNGKEKKSIYLVLGIFCSLIALHVRLDKILIILSLISFYFEPIRGNILSIYLTIYNILKTKIIFILTFIFIICASLLLLFLRHYLIVNEFIFVHTSSMKITMNQNVGDKIVNFVQTVYYVLSSADFWPDKPKFPAVILFIGSFYLIFLSIFRNKKIENMIIPSFSLISIIIIISFYFFHASAYPPRWSTHILPFATIGFVYFIFSLIPKRFMNE